jgi:antitoxin component of MazEF toxin-antitoxin module
MELKLRVKKYGKSYVLVIPKGIIDSTDIKEGSLLIVHSE